MEEVLQSLGLLRNRSHGHEPYSALQAGIESLFDSAPTTYTDEHRKTFFEFRDLLNKGTIRSAEPDPSSDSGWRVNSWVKKGILLGFDGWHR